MLGDKGLRFPRTIIRATVRGPGGGKGLGSEDEAAEVGRVGFQVAGGRFKRGSVFLRRSARWRLY